jgi:hypothetical protein
MASSASSPHSGALRAFEKARPFVLPQLTTLRQERKFG